MASPPEFTREQQEAISRREGPLFLQAATDVGGYSSDENSGGDHGTLTLKVPADKLESVLDKIGSFGTTTAVRLYWARNRLYQLGVMGRAGVENQPETRHFFESFALVRS